MISALGNWIINSKSVGLFFYGFANRLLIPLGLHHILNNLVWFQFGDFTVVQNGASAVVHGDLTRFFQGDTSAGGFMAGFFPVMMFGLPAACLAMLCAAKTAKKKAAVGILLSMALTSFLTGITEPIEFSFMFLAFPLYVVHALLTGVSMALMSLLDVKLGFTFSAGLFDYVLSWGKATHPARMLIVGIVYGVIYFVSFYYIIIRWNLKTPGREEDVPLKETATEVSGKTESAREQTRGYKYLCALGGRENIKVVDACATRLRLEVNDNAKTDEEALKALGAVAVLHPGKGTVQVIIGPAADIIAGEIRKEI
jgi:PTS system N-acetylglucosamine-specific IIC component